MSGMNSVPSPSPPQAQACHTTAQNEESNLGRKRDLVKLPVRRALGGCHDGVLVVENAWLPVRFRFLRVAQTAPPVRRTRHMIMFLAIAAPLLPDTERREDPPQQVIRRDLPSDLT